MENYVKCWLHRCLFGTGEGDSDFCRKPRVSGKFDAMVTQRRGEQVHDELKLITQDERA